MFDHAADLPSAHTGSDHVACPEYVALSRRRFMAASTAAAFAIPACFPRVSIAESHSSTPQDVIVQIYLRGGVDGLSVVAPWSENNYANARSTIRLTAPGRGPMPPSICRAATCSPAPPAQAARSSSASTPRSRR